MVHHGSLPLRLVCLRKIRVDPRHGDRESVTLAAGDAVGFDGDVDHSYSNPGTEPAWFSLTVFEPGVGVATGKKAGDA